MDQFKFKRVYDGQRIQFVPDENLMPACVEYGHRIAEAMVKFAKANLGGNISSDLLG